MSELFLKTTARELYHELGTFDVRAYMRDGVRATDITTVSFLAIDSSGKKMKTSVRIWGNKVIGSFVIDESTPDGSAIGQFSVSVGEETFTRNIYFLVVK